MKRIYVFILGLFMPIILVAQEEVLTNQSVLEMVELGFTSDVILGKIQTTKASFDTTLEALKILKEKGVDNNVIIAMMHSQKSEQDNKKVFMAKKAGIYVKVNNELKKIYPTVFSGSKTNTLGAALSYGLADATIKSTLNGENSQNVIDTISPEFYFYFDQTPTSELSLKATSWWFSVASSPNEFVLVKLNKRGKKREMEIGTVNLYAGNSIGVNEKNVIKFKIEALSDTEFKVTPASMLEPGEYCFYYQGMVPVGGYSNQAVFDFSISYSGGLGSIDYYYESSIEDDSLKGQLVWILKDKKPKQFRIVEIKQKEDGIYYGLGYSLNGFGANFFVKSTECYKSKKELKAALGIK